MSDWNRFKRTWLLNDGNCDAVEEKQARWATRHCWIVYGDVTWVLLFPVLKARYSERTTHITHSVTIKQYQQSSHSNYSRYVEVCGQWFCRPVWVFIQRPALRSALFWSGSARLVFRPVSSSDRYFDSAVIGRLFSHATTLLTQCEVVFLPEPWMAFCSTFLNVPCWFCSVQQWRWTGWEWSAWRSRVVKQLRASVSSLEQAWPALARSSENIC